MTLHSCLGCGHDTAHPSQICGRCSGIYCPACCKRCDNEVLRRELEDGNGVCRECRDLEETDE